MTDFTNAIPTPEEPLPDAEHPVIPWLTQPRRAYIYRALFYVGMALLATGLVTAQVLFAVLTAVAAILGVGLAALNTPTSS